MTDDAKSPRDDSLWNNPTQPPSLLSIGESLGRYQLVELLGRGGMGEVWKAFDPHRDCHVVVKLLPRELLGNVVEVERLRESFRRVNALQHQHICPLYDLGEDERAGHFLVMKFIDGETLGLYRWKVARATGTFGVEQAIAVLKPIAAALDYAHSQHIVHRDVKPANILVRSDGSDPQLVDFGLAAEIRLSMTRVGRFDSDTAGTRPYMAPEQWRGRPQDGRADQYALAVVAYELLSGNPPFQSADVAVLKACVLEEEPPRIAGRPETVYAALARGLAKDADDRYPTCSALVDALAAAAAMPATHPAPPKLPVGPSETARWTSPQSSPAIPPSLAESGRKRGPISELLVTSALILTVAMLGWMFRDDLFGNPTASTKAAPAPSARVANTANNNSSAPLPPTTSPANDTTSSSKNVTAGNTNTQNTTAAPPVPSGAGPVANSADQPPLPDQSKPSSMPPVRPADQARPVDPPSSQPLPPRPMPIDQQLVANLKDAKSMAEEARIRARDGGVEQYLPAGWETADTLLRNGDEQYAGGNLQQALESYRNSTRQFYDSLAEAKRVREISQNFRAHLQQLSEQRESAVAAGAERLVPKDFQVAVTLHDEIVRLHQQRDYVGAAAKRDEAMAAYERSISRARQAADVDLARQAYQVEVKALDENLLLEYGGDSWKQALARIDAAEKMEDLTELESGYHQAIALLPDIRNRIQADKLEQWTTESAHPQILSLLWPEWSEQDAALQQKFVASAREAPEWWLDQAQSTLVRQENLPPYAKAMVWSSIASVHWRSGRTKQAEAALDSALQATKALSDARLASEASLTLARECLACGNRAGALKASARAKLDLDSLDERATRNGQLRTQLEWLKYYLLVRLAAVGWSVGDAATADRYGDLAHARGRGYFASNTDLSACQALVVFAESGDMRSLKMMKHLKNGELYSGRHTGSPKYISLTDRSLTEITALSHYVNTQPSNYDTLIHAELALAAARQGDEEMYLVHHRKAETQITASRLTHVLHTSHVQSRLAIGEAYQQQFEAALSRLENFIKDEFYRGEALLAIGRQQLRRGLVIEAKETLLQLKDDPRATLLAADITANQGIDDLHGAIGWTALLQDDDIRLGSMAGVAAAVSKKP